MEEHINRDFEKWFITQLIEEEKRYYFMTGASKVYVYFEGQSPEDFDALITMRIFSSADITAKYHSGFYRFYIYGLNVLVSDKITNTLSNMLNEIIIEEAGRFRIHTGIISTHQRGNKFKGSSHYENIVDLDYQHWKH